MDTDLGRLLVPPTPTRTGDPLRAGGALTRAALEAMRWEGLVVRAVGDVYLPADTAGYVGSRVAALRMVVPPGSTVGLLAAAWAHGVEVAPEPVDVLVRRSGPSWRKPAWVRERERTLREADVVVLDGLRLTSRTRTAADVARAVATEVARPVVSALLASGVDVEDVRAVVDGERRHAGARHARRLLADL